MSNTVGVHFNINKATQESFITQYPNLVNGLVNRGAILTDYYTYDDVETAVNNGEYEASNIVMYSRDVFLKFITGDKNRINTYKNYMNYFNPLMNISIALTNSSTTAYTEGNPTNAIVYYKTIDILNLFDFMKNQNSIVSHCIFDTASSIFDNLYTKVNETINTQEYLDALASTESSGFLMSQCFLLFNLKNPDIVEFIDNNSYSAMNNNVITVGKFNNVSVFNGRNATDAEGYDGLVKARPFIHAAKVTGYPRATSFSSKAQMSDQFKRFPYAHTMYIGVAGSEAGKLQNPHKSLLTFMCGTQPVSTDLNNDAADGSGVTQTFSSNLINKLNAGSTRSIAFNSLYCPWDNITIKGINVVTLNTAGVFANSSTPIDKIKYLYPNLENLIANKLINTVGSSTQIYFKDILTYFPKLKQLALYNATPGSGGAITVFPALVRAYLGTGQKMAAFYNNFIANIATNNTLQELMIVFPGTSTTTDTATPTNAQLIFNKFPNLKALNAPITKLDRSDIDRIPYYLIYSQPLNMIYGSCSVNSNVEALGINWSSGNLYTGNNLSILASKFPNLKILKIYYNGSNTGLSLAGLENFSKLEQLYIVSTKTGTGGASISQITQPLTNLKLFFNYAELRFPINNFDFATYMPNLEQYICASPYNRGSVNYLDNIPDECLVFDDWYRTF